MTEWTGDEVLQTIERIVPRQTRLVRGPATAWREGNCGGTAEGLEEWLALVWTMVHGRLSVLDVEPNRLPS
jgi:hypothetical protein